MREVIFETKMLLAIVTVFVIVLVTSVTCVTGHAVVKSCSSKVEEKLKMPEEFKNGSVQAVGKINQINRITITCGVRG